MQAHMQTVEELPRRKPKKKPLAQPQSVYQVKGDNWTKTPQSSLNTEKFSKRKRNLKDETSPPLSHSDQSTPDSLPDSFLSNNDYRIFRHKYLLLEEENSQLGKELGEVEVEVKSLEDEKHALLDKLVVLEGLMDPSELLPL